MQPFSHFCCCLVLLLSLFNFVVSSHAQTTPAQSTPATAEVTLEELITRALQNNPQPAIARANLEAARQSASALRSLPNPVLQIVPGFTGSDEARDEEILLSQPLDLFGQRRAERRVLEAESRRAAAESTLITRALIIEVKNAATQLFAAQEVEVLATEQVQVAEAFRAAAARRAELGDIPPVQVQRADLELLREQNSLSNARGELLSRRAILNQLIGQSPETPLRVALPTSAATLELLRRPAIKSTPPDSVTLSTTATPPKDAPQSKASNVIFSQRDALLSGVINRPDIAGAQATLEARRARVAAIARQRLPQVEVQARRSAVFGSGDVALRAVITAPVFDFGSIKREKRAAQAQVAAQEAQINLLRSQAKLQVEQALILLDAQRATLARYQTGIVPQTLDLLRKTQIGFAEGASSYLEVLEAQRTLRQVQAEYLQALVGARAAEAQLEAAVGSAPEKISTQPNSPDASTPREGAR